MSTLEKVIQQEHLWDDERDSINVAVVVVAYARAYHSNEWCSHPLVDDWRRILRDPANSQVDPVMGNLVVGLRYASEEVHVSESDPTFPQSVDIEDLCSGTCLSKKCNPKCCLGPVPPRYPRRAPARSKRSPRHGECPALPLKTTRGRLSGPRSNPAG